MVGRINISKRKTEMEHHMKNPGIKMCSAELQYSCIILAL